VAKGDGYRTVLLDLDGTLADTAPDLIHALNAVRTEDGLSALAAAAIRPHVSNGSRTLISIGFGTDESHPEFERRRLRFLKIYSQRLCVDTRLFPGMTEVIDEIEKRGHRWGVVTNKPAWLTEPLLRQLGLTTRATCVVSGDTVARAKPHPDPLLHAAAACDSAPADCVYVGDARRDIEAGRAAGMGTLVALFGYLSPGDDPVHWGADAMVRSPDEILGWIAPAS
jgi:phosphoglycolate phosphatase